VCIGLDAAIGVAQHDSAGREQDARQAEKTDDAVFVSDAR